MIRILLIGLVCVAIGGCQDKVSSDDETAARAPQTTSVEKLTPPAETASVTGAVTYRQRIALSPEAVIIVKLSDVSLQDVAATVITEQVIRPQGRQVPIPFQLDYDPAQIDPRNTYAVGVRIEEDGRLMFINTSAYHVITRGAPTEVEVVVEMVRSGE